ncbi:MAG TPA: hypothetical protein VMQ76_01210 [Terracidiphilus sp.]|nr:hypothetical protein [Terracidiphilus sp.]
MCPPTSDAVGSAGLLVVPWMPTETADNSTPPSSWLGIVIDIVVTCRY